MFRVSLYAHRAKGRKALPPHKPLNLKDGNRIKFGTHPNTYVIRCESAGVLHCGLRHATSGEIELHGNQKRRHFLAMASVGSPYPG